MSVHQLAPNMRIVHEILHWRPITRAAAAALGIAVVCIVSLVGHLVVRGLSRSRGAVVDGQLVALATKKCADDCRAIDHDQGCDSFCLCQVKALVARTEPADLVHEWSKKSAEDFTPEFLRQVQLTTAECGADIVDRRFMHSCVAGCGQTTGDCLETCECILDNLRGTGNRTESTLKIVEQESQPSNPETESRMREVLAKCQSALKPVPSPNGNE